MLPSLRPRKPLAKNREGVSAKFREKVYDYSIIKVHNGSAYLFNIILSMSKQVRNNTEPENSIKCYHIFFLVQLLLFKLKFILGQQSRPAKKDKGERGGLPLAMAPTLKCS